jgi:hypothetical protein
MIKKIMLYILIFLILVFAFFFIGKPSASESIVWGVNFSHKHAELLGLDWKEAYLALIDDMGVGNIKLATYWDLIEKEQGNYDFEDLDWQIAIAQEKGVKLLLTVGMKAPRWPECHFPGWAENMEKEAQQEKILALIEEIVSRYSLSPAIVMWQVENEPFFPFGRCQWTDKGFLKKEIELVKSLDQLNRPVLISDSGEGSFWIQAARFGDVVGTTMYRKVWFHQLEAYISYPFPPIFYARKAKIIEKLFNKEVINVELQAEPWGPKLLYDSPLSEQEKTMNLEQFRKNIEFAKQTGFKEFYLWGAEWWYWMKEKQEQPEIWQEAKKLFGNH